MVLQDAAKTLSGADGAGLMVIGQGQVLRWVPPPTPHAQILETAQERLGEDDPGQEPSR